MNNLENLEANEVTDEERDEIDLEHYTELGGEG